MLMIGTDRQRVLQTIDYRADLCVDIILSLDVIAIPSHTGQVEVYISSPRTLVRVLVMHFFFTIILMTSTSYALDHPCQTRLNGLAHYSQLP